MPFLFDADQLALDFLNTGHVAGGVAVDVLSAPETLVAWLREAGALTREEAAGMRASPPDSRRLLQEAHRLRDAILAAVTAWTRGVLTPDPALMVLNRALAARATGLRVDREGAGLRLVETARHDGILGGLAPLALAAVTLLTSADPGRVRRCGADDCGLWFLDTSRNGSRRWCSMARCGNRAKVAAHYRRTARSARAAQVAVPLLVALLTAAIPATAQTLAFTGATVWDGSGSPPIPDATILVRGGHILAVGHDTPPAGATVIDLSGTWVVSGLVNAHGHVTGLWASEDERGDAARMEGGDLLLYARYGVTTVNSLGDEPPGAAVAVRSGNDRPDLTRARFHFAGPVITSTSSEEAAAQVRVNVEAGVDWIKIRVDDNLGATAKMPWPAAQTVMDEAHARGVRVATHLFYQDDAKRLLRMGSGLVAHSVRDADVDAELVELLRRTGACYVPTLTREVSTFVYGGHPDFFDDPFFRRWADARQVARASDPAYMRRTAESPAAARYRVGLGQAQRNLRALADAGIPIAMGTDSGPAGRFPGYFEHMELGLMAEAGLTPEQILRSATGVAADCLGLDDVGMLRPGRWADFLVLTADPLADVAATRTLTAVYVAGNRVR